MAGRAGRRVYRTRRWRSLRRVIFKRDDWRCVLCGRAGRLECDHMRAITDGGSWFDPDNLRSICRTCHIAETRERTSKVRLSKARAKMKELSHNAGI